MTSLGDKSALKWQEGRRTEWVRGYWHDGETGVRDKRAGLSVSASFLRPLHYSDITSTQLQAVSMKELPQPALMDISYTGDSALLSPHHLTSLCLNFPWWPLERRVTTMAVSCQRWNKTRRTAQTHNLRRHGLTFSKRQPWHIRPFQFEHTRDAYKHTVHSHWGHWKYPVTHTGPAVCEDDIRVNREGWVHLHTAWSSEEANTRYVELKRNAWPRCLWRAGFTLIPGHIKAYAFI